MSVLTFFSVLTFLFSVLSVAKRQLVGRSKFQFPSEHLAPAFQLSLQPLNLSSSLCPFHFCVGLLFRSRLLNLTSGANSQKICWTEIFCKEEVVWVFRGQRALGPTDNREQTCTSFPTFQFFSPTSDFSAFTCIFLHFNQILDCGLASCYAPTLLLWAVCFSSDGQTEDFQITYSIWSSCVKNEAICWPNTWYIP